MPVPSNIFPSIVEQEIRNLIKEMKRNFEQIKEDLKEKGRCIVDYGKCMGDCLKDNPAVKRFQKGNSNCTDGYIDCIGMAGGLLRGMQMCSTLKKACQAGVLIDVLAFGGKEYNEQFMRCHKGCTSD